MQIIFEISNIFPKLIKASQNINLLLMGLAELCPLLSCPSCFFLWILLITGNHAGAGPHYFSDQWQISLGNCKLCPYILSEQIIDKNQTNFQLLQRYKNHLIYYILFLIIMWTLPSTPKPLKDFYGPVSPKKTKKNSEDPDANLYEQDRVDVGLTTIDWLLVLFQGCLYSTRQRSLYSCHWLSSI